MVNKKVVTPNNNSTDDEDSMEEMRPTMDDLCRNNQTFEDNFIHIKERHLRLKRLSFRNPNLSLMKYRGHECQRTSTRHHFPNNMSSLSTHKWKLLELLIH